MVSVLRNVFICEGDTSICWEGRIFVFGIFLVSTGDVIFFSGFINLIKEIRFLFLGSFYLEGKRWSGSFRVSFFFESRYSFVFGELLV